MILCILLLATQQPPFWAHKIIPPDRAFPTLVGESSQGYVFSGSTQEIWLAGRNAPVQPVKVESDYFPEDTAGSFVTYKVRKRTVDAAFLNGFVQVFDLHALESIHGRGTNLRTHSYLLPEGNALGLMPYPRVGARISREGDFWRCPDEWEFIHKTNFAPFDQLNPHPVVAFTSGRVACTYVEDAEGKEPHLRAARWKSSDTKPESAPMPTGVTQTTAEAINNKGNVAGRIVVEGKMKNYFWKGDKLTVIEPPAGGPSETLACPILASDDDWVIGRWIDKKGDIVGQAWAYRDGKMSWLKDIAGGQTLDGIYSVKLAANARDLLATSSKTGIGGWYRLVGKR